MTFWNNKRNLLRFIELYQSIPALWRVKSKEYKNNLTRELGYEKLVQLCQQFNPEADKAFVVTKINSLRGAYRKEFRKVEDSKLSGAGSDQVYEPTLWYYPHLAFIQDQEVPRRGLSNLDIARTEVCRYILCLIK